jgi:hypothetical protein
VDRKDPQFKQTLTLGNTKIDGLSGLLSPGKWMFISESNSARLADAQELQMETSFFMVFHSFHGDSRRRASSRFRVLM